MHRRHVPLQAADAAATAKVVSLAWAEVPEPAKQVSQSASRPTCQSVNLPVGQSANLPVGKSCHGVIV